MPRRMLIRMYCRGLFANAEYTKRGEKYEKSIRAVFLYRFLRRDPIETHPKSRDVHGDF